MPDSKSPQPTKPPRRSGGLLTSPLVSTILIMQGMIAVSVGVGLSMAKFGPPRPAAADIAAGSLMAIGVMMLALSFWIRQRSLREFRPPRDMRP
ncbi:MAG: hypothetical protein P8J33_18270 [Pirellulaceae bacterium]|nr:hypothetical protein [Pirellulaceae bacterium]